MKKKTIGIIGGMGPLATADLFAKIIRATNAASDSGHIHIIVDNDPSIPDRTGFILHGGESPVESIVRSARLLQNAGADILAMPCNAAHCFIEEIQDQIEIPLLNMIELTAAHLKENGVSRAALLAVDGTVRTGVYSRACEKYGVELILPRPALQRRVMEVIYDGIKAGKTQFDVSALQRGIDSLARNGAQKIILGCTELPLAAEHYSLRGDFTDPTSILARAAVISAGYSAF
ncbi:MAG: amino acid racemase [Clostridia bacterium]|nr:amino acid racemase [Clostridia bacterium]